VQTLTSPSLIRIIRQLASYKYSKTAHILVAFPALASCDLPVIEDLPGFIREPTLRCLRIVRNKILVHHVARAFKRLSDEDNAIARLVALSISFRKYRVSIAPLQVPSEIIRFLQMTKELKPLTVLEIGTARGGTLFLFTRVAMPEARLVTVDLPGGPFGGGYPDWMSVLLRSFARDKQRIDLVRGDSHSDRTNRLVRELVGSIPVDVLFIDGDHTYEGVRRDFETYSGLVRKGGLVAFHDIVPGPAELGVGVPKFWNEIKSRYEHTEIIAHADQGAYGIGVLQL